MTPVVTTMNIASGGVFVVTVNENGTIFTLTGDPTINDFTFSIDPAQSVTLTGNMVTAQNQLSLEKLILVQSQFEQEMGQDLLVWNSQALVKDPSHNYVQTTTKLAFEAYQKGLDGPPA